MGSLSCLSPFPRYRLWFALACLGLVLLFGANTFPGVPLASPEVPASSVSLPVSEESSTPRPATFSLTGTETLQLLLIGRDQTEGGLQGRSDAIILCTLHRSEERLVMTSLLRDLYLTIPGHGQNRLNAAYAFGGAELLSQTLEENFGVRPDGWLEVDFSGFSTIVDTLGGVSLVLSQAEAEEINRKTGGALTEGRQTLQGEEALAYVRIRKLDEDGDFSRTARQQKLLEAIVEAGRSSKASTLLALLGQVLPLMKTSLTTGQLLRLAPEVLTLVPRLEIQKQQIPEPGTFAYETIRGMSVLDADLEAARRALEKALAPMD